MATPVRARARNAEGTAIALEMDDGTTYAVSPTDGRLVGMVIEPYELIRAIPASLTARQARLGLLGAGLLEAADDAIGKGPRDLRIEWEYASVIERQSPLLLAIAGQMELTPAQVDDLFRAAATL